MESKSYGFFFLNTLTEYTKRGKIWANFVFLLEENKFLLTLYYSFN